MSRTSPLLIVFVLAVFLFVIFVMMAGFFFMSRQGGGWDSDPALFDQKGEGVGVVEIKGVILDSKKILKRLKRFEEHPDVKGVVVRLDSPGGAVAPSQEIYEAVKDYEKPIVASMGSVAASGAYYISVGAKKIFANPGTLTGSIGVIMEFVNLEKLYEWAKIKRFSLRTGDFKGSGTPYRKMTPAERRLLQGMINDVHAQFKEAVREGRELTDRAVDRLADGRVMSGRQAKAFKLVDELGTIDDAVGEVARMAKLEGEPRVIYPDRSRRFDWIDFILDNRPDEDAQAASQLASQLASGQGIFGALHQANISLLSPGLYWLWNGAR